MSNDNKFSLIERCKIITSSTCTILKFTRSCCSKNVWLALETKMIFLGYNSKWLFVYIVKRYVLTCPKSFYFFPPWIWCLSCQVFVASLELGLLGHRLIFYSSYNLFALYVDPKSLSVAYFSLACKEIRSNRHATNK
jgi:hypothetical protein